MVDDQQLQATPSELDKKIVRDADELRITMQTQGWKTIIQPLIDKMITDSMGCKEDGMWSEGAIEDARMCGIELEKIIWYRKALIEFNNTIQQTLLDAERIKHMQMLDEKNQGISKKEEMLMPMHDTAYKDSPEVPTFAEKYSGGLTSG